MRALVLIAGILVLIVGGFALFALLGDNSGTPSSGQEIVAIDADNEMAPKFNLPDYTGTERNSAEFEGKVQVVNIWATWCPFCVDELPDFAALQEEFEEEITVIAINRGESRNTAKEFSDEIGIGNRVMFLLDANESYYRSIGGFAMPETLFINPNGSIHLHKRGPLSLGEMRTIINQMIQ